MTILEEVAAERRRQITVEGYTPEHDDSKNRHGELADAAACYCAASEKISFVNFFPWPRRRWKPKGHRRNLIRAAALIVAEIERLDRAAAKEKPDGA